MYEKVVIEYANDRQKHRKYLNHTMQHEVAEYALSVKSCKESGKVRQSPHCVILQ